MSERLSSPTDIPTGRPSPLDVMKAIKRRNERAQVPDRSAEEVIVDQEPHHDTDLVGINGEYYRRVPQMRYTKRFNGQSIEEIEVPYTFREWYSHSFIDHNTGMQLQGPGWDSRFSLSNNESAMQLHGRTFNTEEFLDPAHNMPETPYYRLQRVDNPQEDFER